jgi:hypothetical protein
MHRPMIGESLSQTALIQIRNTRRDFLLSGVPSHVKWLRLWDPSTADPAA